MESQTTGSILKNKKAEIIQKWLQKIKGEIPQSKKHEELLLKNDLPNLIDELADALDSGKLNPMIKLMKNMAL